MYRVLLVDDEKQALDGLKIMIDWNAYGFEICGCAKNGEAALGMIESHSPDLVVTDIKMPKLTGVELAREAYSKYKHVKFIIISGYSEFKYATEAMRYGVKYYCYKPIDLGEMGEALANIKNDIDREEFFRYMRETGLMDESAHENVDLDILSIERDCKDITKSIVMFDEDDVKQKIELLFENPDTNGFERLALLYYKLVYDITGLIREMKTEPGKFFYEAEKIYGTVRSPDALKEHIRILCLGVMDFLRRERKQNFSDCVSQAEEYIKNNFDRDVTVKELAKLLYTHPVYLGNLFSKKMGIGINEYTNKLRTKKAAELICETDLTINEIANTVGFNNYNNFFRNFEKHMGKSPVEYRRTHEVSEHN